MEKNGTRMQRDGSLTVRPLVQDEMVSIYRERMVHDFPTSELKPLMAIQRALRRGEYRSYGAVDADGIAAYAFFVTARIQGKSVWLFDYYAVEKTRRDQGIGSMFLRRLQEQVLPEADLVLLEIDNPDAAQGGEKALRLRREAFYLRNGLRDTGVRAVVFQVSYRILEVPVHRAHAEEEAGEMYRELYRQMLPAPLFRRMIQIL